MKRTRKSEAAETKVRIPQRPCWQWGCWEGGRERSGSALGEGKSALEPCGASHPLSLTVLPIKSRSRTGRRHKPTISAQVKALFPPSLSP